MTFLQSRRHQFGRPWKPPFARTPRSCMFQHLQVLSYCYLLSAAIAFQGTGANFPDASKYFRDSLLDATSLPDIHIFMGASCPRYECREGLLSTACLLRACPFASGRPSLAMPSTADLTGLAAPMLVRLKSRSVLQWTACMHHVASCDGWLRAVSSPHQAQGLLCYLHRPPSGSSECTQRQDDLCLRLIRSYTREREAQVFVPHHTLLHSTKSQQ